MVAHGGLCRRFVLCGMACLLAASSQEAPSTRDIPLDIRYPGLVKCDPAEMYGCMSRCSSGVTQEENADRKLCLTIRCIRDCSRTTSRDCPSKSLAACEKLLSLIDVARSQCYLDCNP
mmetsp:Transcript_60393/g.124995  ORF Transcript_60393/g.124995 Transcript_60393/m.124995 type:complete len:118 (+) Transcript_60393:51-404(+)